MNPHNDPNNESNESPRVPVRCFKCVAGCIHLEYGAALFTFTEPQFRALAEVVGEAYRQLQAEREASVDDDSGLAAPLVM